LTVPCAVSETDEILLAMYQKRIDEA